MKSTNQWKSTISSRVWGMIVAMWASGMDVEQIQQQYGRKYPKAQIIDIIKKYQLTRSGVENQKGMYR